MLSRGHNNLRISRIISSAGLLGQQRLQYPLIAAMVEEVFGPNALLPKSARSCKEFWVPAMDDDEEKEDLRRRIEELESLKSAQWIVRGD